MDAADAHIDPEDLAMLAVGDDSEAAAYAAHLATCAECSSELDELRGVVTIGRSSLGAGPLLTPPDRVWQSIQAELHGVTPISEAPTARARTPRRAWIAGLIAAVFVVIAAVGGGVALSLRNQPTVLAQATLDAFPAWPTATGEATVEKQSNGERTVVVALTAPTTSDGLREVWLINKDATGLVSLGLLDGSNGRFVVPADIDLSEYRQVDISEEPLNGDPAHSGNSIVRGTLRAESRSADS